MTRLRLVVAGILGGCAAAYAAAVCPGPAIATVPPTSTSSTLHVGQRLTAAASSQPGGASIVADNGQYQFGLFYNAGTSTSGGVGIEIDQIGLPVIAGLWRRQGAATPQAFATLRSDGNFVLYAAPGKPIWSTHTAGTGTDNSLVIQNDGQLVVRTAAGRVVWSSHTHREVLESGDRLTAGHYLKNVFSTEAPPTYLRMRRGGQLVVTFRGATVWSSNTVVPGSYLQMNPDGDLVLSSPTARPLWTSGTGRLASPSDGQPFLDVGTDGHFVVQFTPADGVGGGIVTVFDSARRPGELGRTSPGPVRMMTAGSVLGARQSLVSGTGHRLTMQRNGGLVLRDRAGTVRWRSGTGGHPGAVLALRRDGNLVIRLGAQRLWSIRHDAFDHPFAINLVVTRNGDIVAHGVEGGAVWTSRTGS
ncbi:MAG TPA: hypothetical protein VN088_01175 [Nocardioides sp.]|nr:hypothetical protein [Nocardioides sp.]